MSRLYYVKGEVYMHVGQPQDSYQFKKATSVFILTALHQTMVISIVSLIQNT